MKTHPDSTIAPSSAAAWERAKKSIGGGVSSGLRAAMKPHPIFVDRAEGAVMWDIDGREYLDYIGGWGPMVLGHSHPGVLAAVAEVLPRMQMPGTGHVLEYEAAEAVLAAVPDAERLLWSNTGTEAVQIALRLARARTARNRIVKFVHAYHGWHDTVLASVAVHTTGERATPNTRGQNPRAVEDLIVLPFNDTEAVRRTLVNAQALDIAAVLIDPILNSGGGVEPDPEFLRTLRSCCDEHGVVLVFDEVVSGFRVARGGASERWGVTPDLWTVGKAIANGFSQSAVLGRAVLIDQVMDGVVHAGTYNGNPVALAAVKATMAAQAEPGAYDRLEQLSQRLRKGLADLFEWLGVPLRAHGVASVVGVSPTGRGGMEDLGRLNVELVHQGVLMIPRGEMFVSMAHSEEQIDATISAFEEACVAAGLTTGPSGTT
ncbi:aminotransferase class III-fold pyridoxal phosphate-dependent enzyme [Streptomyces sp. NPDC004237]|uniref:aspartate aminotransferase family protein n=1 Tax=Streptomyces sp. NPDC004237 TaxID=3154455 RepID=UPI0033B9B80C